MKLPTAFAHPEGALMSTYTSSYLRDFSCRALTLALTKNIIPPPGCNQRAFALALSSEEIPQILKTLFLPFFEINNWFY